MKKLILFIVGILVFTSCSYQAPSNVNNVTHKGVEFIKIGTVEYEKIVIDGHDFLFRSYSTSYTATGSDLEHSPICGKCKK